MSGGQLNTGSAGTTIKYLEGYGTLGGDVHMQNGLFIVDSSEELNITGNFTGYGIVVGSHNKSIDSPTGSVNYDNVWSIGRSDITVYSIDAPVIHAGVLADGYIFSLNGWEFGTLSGNVRIGGNVAVQAVLSPGFSPGEIIFEDDLSLSLDSSTVIEFAGTGSGEYDFLSIGGSFSMAGGLNVSFLDGFDPSAGLLPTWFSADSFSGSFDNISWSGLGDDKMVTFNEATGRLAIQAIPEPGLCGLITLGLGSLLLHRRRRTPASV